MAAPELLVSTVTQAQLPTERPWVTVTYAQSLDGSIASSDRRPLQLSGPESLAMTHWLRSAHDAILVGIGTVIADDPRLTVRLLAGDHPQPIVLDTHLRFPLTAALLRHPRSVWLATAANTGPEARQPFIERGARVLSVDLETSDRLSLPDLMTQLYGLGVRRLMVEGGAEVIREFLMARLCDLVVITVAPYLVGGLRPLEKFSPSLQAGDLQIEEPTWVQLGTDVIVWGKPGFRRALTQG